MSETVNKDITEKELKALPGMLMLILITAGELVSGLLAFGFLLGFIESESYVLMMVIFFAVFIILFFAYFGLKIVRPNEAMVFTLFGKYHGTIKKSGFYFINPFATAFNSSRKMITTAQGANVFVGPKAVSLKVSTLDNQKQKVNDILGNPIIIGAVVIWKVVDPTKAVFAVENYQNYLSIQCDSTIRNIARLYPYDDMDDKDGIDEKTLRGSSQEIAERMTKELQSRVDEAGLEILEVRITHLSYAEEIAAAMLQRQQAVAIIAARRKIVEGAVSMVEMAIEQLNEKEVVVLDDERKAQMVSNLMVVLCGNKEAQPIVNSGSIY